MPEQAQLDFDICARKHGGNPESVAAFKMGDKARDRHHVLTLLMVAPMTAKEIARAMGKPLNAISGRCSDLKKLGHAEETGVRREGSMELRAK